MKTKAPIFNFPARPPAPDMRRVRVIVNRPMRLRPAGAGELRHVDRGEAITITMDDCARLDPSDYVLTPSRRKRACL
jgi:hypothetical protein